MATEGWKTTSTEWKSSGHLIHKQWKRQKRQLMPSQLLLQLSRQLLQHLLRMLVMQLYRRTMTMRKICMVRVSILRQPRKRTMASKSKKENK